MEVLAIMNLEEEVLEYRDLSEEMKKYWWVDDKCMRDTQIFVNTLNFLSTYYRFRIVDLDPNSGEYIEMMRKIIEGRKE